MNIYNSFSGFLRRFSLAKRITLIVILASLILALIAATILTILDYQNELEQLEYRLEQINRSEIPSLSNSLWHFDLDQVQSQLQGIHNIQDVVYEQLEIEGGKTIVIGQLVDKNDQLTHSFDINYTRDSTSYYLGRLTVTADLQNLKNRVAGRLFGNLLMAGLQMFILAALILFIVNRLFIHPLNEIVQFAENLNIDHLDQPLIISRTQHASKQDEFDLVALRINEMSQRLLLDIEEQKKMEAALVESEQNYREIFNATSEAIMIHDADSGKILQVNSTMREMYGFADDFDIRELTVGMISSNDEFYNQKNADLYLQKAREEGPQIIDWHSKKSNGVEFWVEITLRSTVINGQNRILAVIRDISELKQSSALLLQQNKDLLEQKVALKDAELKLRELNLDLERRVNERTIQLAELNTELESFSYSVAHDLQAPLRVIHGYSAIILEDKSDCLDDTTREYFLKIQNSVIKMSTLIDDLLKLAKINRKEIAMEEIDLANVAKEIFSELSDHQPDRKVSFIVPSKLVAVADLNLMTIVLDNLIRNAWKFTSKLPSARIEVGSYIENERLVYFVRDNGAGFDQSKAERLFRPFERLHVSDDFEGTGIGLAMTKRIIQRHYGRIWAEGKVDQGATFFFTLSDS